MCGSDEFPNPNTKKRSINPSFEALSLRSFYCSVYSQDLNIYQWRNHKPNIVVPKISKVKAKRFDSFYNEKKDTYLKYAYVVELNWKKRKHQGMKNQLEVPRLSLQDISTANNTIEEMISMNK